MLIGEPMPSQYDWRFRFLGFPIRVTWLFWLVAAALGYNIAMGMDDAYQFSGVYSPGFPVLLCIWVAATLVSILVHELGHTLAYRWFGIESQIVLYHMGGLAIPTAGYLYQRGGIRRRLTHGNQILVSAAGPLLQLATGIAVAGGATALGIKAPFVQTFLNAVGWEFDFSKTVFGGLPNNAWVDASVMFYVLISVMWPLFNLLPVYPLDGGHIVQHTVAILRRTDGLYEANMVGVVVGFLVAWWFFQTGQTFNALLFLSLAMSNMQALQQQQGPRIW
ncbi:MAG: site-2 protease family protein [Planctomycetota bacterium]|jgi:stage IV sporulation protein FB